MAARPGFVLYFDLYPVVARLSREDRGDLFLAMFEYCMVGAQPTLSEAASLVWPLIQQRLEYDDKSYQRRLLREEYRNFCRDYTGDRRDLPDFMQWQKQERGRVILKEYYYGEKDSFARAY